MAFIEGRGKIISVVIAVLVIAASIAGIIHFLLGNRIVPDGQTVRDFFVDENTLEPERHTAFEIPPLPGKDGQPTVVIAAYYRFANSSEKKLWYLKKFPPEIKIRLEDDMKANKGKPNVLLWMEIGGEALVRSPEKGSPWVKISSPEGQKVILAPVDSNGLAAFPYMPQ